MAVKIIDGDLFSASSRYICHQVNCRGRMGSGIAKVIRDKFPEAFEKYKEECKKGACLGHVQYVLSNGKIIINMFAQDGYGYDGARYTDYDAFMNCLLEIKSAVPNGATIAMLYKIGCGLGGGAWNTIYGFIENFLGHDYTVELWRL